MTGKRKRTNYDATMDSREEAPSAGATAVRTRPVRITVDLPPSEHRRFKRWLNDAAGELDWATVPAAEVVRVLLDQLDQDPELSDRVRSSLRTRRE